MLIHMICGMGVEVAGTKHVAAASFDVAGGHIKNRVSELSPARKK
jgi:hypothetical protein